jgi:hypothetical protein
MDDVYVDFASALLWLASFCVAAFFARTWGWKRWWLVFSAPFALFPALEILFVFLTWKTGGFAP